MRKIIKIENVEMLKDDHNEPYWRTHAVVDDGTECVGFGKDFDLGDKVEVFHDSKWDKVKMRKTPTKDTQ